MGGSQDDSCMAPNKRPGNLFMTPVFHRIFVGIPFRKPHGSEGNLANRQAERAILISCTMFKGYRGMTWAEEIWYSPRNRRNPNVGSKILQSFCGGSQRGTPDCGKFRFERRP